MTQLRGKVNHFGKTNVSNLYKNQQITNHLDPVLCLLTRSVAVGSQPAVQTAGLYNRPGALRGYQRLEVSCYIDVLD